MCRKNINLIDYGINIPKKVKLINIPDNNGVTPLMNICIHGNLETVKFLINSGADITMVDNNNKSAYTYALENNHIEIINYFNTLL